MLNEQVGQFLPSLNIPTVIIFGEKDEFIPNRLIHPLESTRSIAESGSRTISGSKHFLIPKAGHFVHIEKFEEVNALIDEFIGK
jgi:pimeloyl-ACP methyl ester carboxylesterase